MAKLRYLQPLGGCYSHIVKQLYRRKDIDINSKDNNSRTPLSHTTATGDAVTVNLLLQRRGIAIDLKDNNSRTPLSWATTNSDNIVTLFLLRNNVNIGLKDNNSQTALDQARNQGLNTSILFSKWPDIECYYKKYYQEMRNCCYRVPDVLRKARKKGEITKTSRKRKREELCKHRREGSMYWYRDDGTRQKHVEVRIN